MAVDAMNPYARECQLWERDQLGGGRGAAKSERIEWLQRRPISHTEEHALLVHASPRDPIDEYLLLGDSSWRTEAGQRALSDLFSRVSRVCFVGHTHEPGWMDESGFAIRAVDLQSAELPLNDDKKYIVNVGSVGQPRDGDYRACYVVWDGRAVRFRRVDYAVLETQRKIRATGVLANLEAERLTWKRR